MSLGSQSALTIFTITDNHFVMVSRATEIFAFENVEIGPAHVSANLTVPPEFPFFHGHFPGNPVLPAVSIVDASYELLRLKSPEISVENISLKRCRFTHTVRPNEKVYIDAKFDGKNSWNLTWYDNQQKQVMAQINVLL